MFAEFRTRFIIQQNLLDSFWLSAGGAGKSAPSTAIVLSRFL